MILQLLLFFHVGMFFTMTASTSLIAQKIQAILGASSVPQTALKSFQPCEYSQFFATISSLVNFLQFC